MPTVPGVGVANLAGLSEEEGGQAAEGEGQAGDDGAVGERQVRALLGEPTPSEAERDRWADRAVEHFLVLHRP